ncbi:probable disease resistance protein RF45 [Corylus avellana]|uniref:probable disease resistance protein RF45 n=1 Tax=Corylus avellana TaxID=13451 RepID=UPI00286A201F|nr:probable disease resistance protein RF45 [Corylus avellana]
MDFVDVVEVVSAVIQELMNAGPYEELYAIHRVINQVEKTIKDLRRIKNFLTYGELKEMLEKLLDAVYKMEYFADMFVLRRMHVKRMGFGLRQTLNLKAKKADFGSEMKKIVEEIDGVITSVLSRQSPTGEESGVSGSVFQRDKANLMAWLTDTNSLPNLGYILISGVSSYGKTIFATEIYTSPESERHFDFRIWVSDSVAHECRRIFRQINGYSDVPKNHPLEKLEDSDRAFSEELKDLDRAFSEELKDLDRAFSEELKDLERAFSEELKDLERAFSEEMKDLDRELSEELKDLEGEFSEELKDLEGEFSEELKDLDREFINLPRIFRNGFPDELKEEIGKILHKKRCLVVADNLQSPHDIFNTIPRSALLDEGNGSRVIITTMTTAARNEYVIKNSLDKIEPLPDEDAWKLFKNKVGISDDDQSSDLDKLKINFLEICKGISSAILVLGGVLSKKKCYEEWLAVLDQHYAVLEQYFTDSKILEWMIENKVTSGSRLCLLYFGVFPKGYEIPVRRLLRLWIAEGLIVTDHPNPEEIAERILTMFTCERMIEIVKWRKDGSPKTCRIPDNILHDILLSKAEDIFGLLHLHIHPTTPDTKSSSSDHASPSPSPSPKFSVRRVSGDIKNYSPKEYSHMQQLRSYLSFNTQNKDTPALEIGNFLREVIGRQGFGLLRVLDLERVYKPKLPENLGKLSLLRYLGLRWTFLDTLPHSVSELSYLETLDVKHTYISSLPNSIWKFQYLRHLCLNEIRLDMPPLKKQGISLTGLYTLWGLFMDNKSPVVGGLDGLINLQKLGLTFHLDSIKDGNKKKKNSQDGEEKKIEDSIKDPFEVLNEWIASLKQLRYLRLRSINEFGQPSELKLRPLSRLKYLHSLYLLGNLPELHDECFPCGIKVLTLSVSKLKKDPMPILAKLPNLSVLRLLADSYVGKDMVCPNGGFQSLTNLKLWMLKKLDTWRVEEGAMPNLKELEIRCCHELKELPDKLLNPSSIKKIILTNMQEEFVANVGAKIPKEILEIQQPLRVRCQYCRHDVKQV